MSKVVATYLVRITLRSDEEVEPSTPPTLDALTAAIEAALTDLVLTLDTGPEINVSAERVDR